VTDPNTRVTEARRIAALFTGLLLAPVAFLANLEIAYALVHPACRLGNRLPLHAVHAGAVVFALAGLLTAWRIWRAEGVEWPAYAGGPLARTRFLAGLGVATSALFLLVLVAQWIPSFVLSPCQ
jgi:hypothetical protein